MSKNLKNAIRRIVTATTLAIVGTALMTPAHAQTLICGETVLRSTTVATSHPAANVPKAQAPAAGGVIYKAVQQTPQYDLRRPEVVSGARVTLFANFLRQESGVVLFNLSGTSTECNLVEWLPNSVTIELPRLGLLEPKNAEIQIVLPDGRIAKTFPVLFISQPDIVIHQDTIPQPTPPAPTSRSATYAASVQGSVAGSVGE